MLHFCGIGVLFSSIISKIFLNNTIKALDKVQKIGQAAL